MYIYTGIYLTYYHEKILFNMYYHYSMIIDAIPGVAEINDY